MRLDRIAKPPVLLNLSGTATGLGVFCANFPWGRGAGGMDACVRPLDYPEWGGPHNGFSKAYRGISHYGNCLECDGGCETVFDLLQRNPLVNVFRSVCFATMRFSWRATGLAIRDLRRREDGRDGIKGASMASASSTKIQGQASQRAGGDPFMEKLLLECLSRAAAHLTSGAGQARSAISWMRHGAGAHRSSRLPATVFP